METSHVKPAQEFGNCSRSFAIAHFEGFLAIRWRGELLITLRIGHRDGGHDYRPHRQLIARQFDQAKSAVSDSDQLGAQDARSGFPARMRYAHVIPYQVAQKAITGHSNMNARKDTTINQSGGRYAAVRKQCIIQEALKIPAARYAAMKPKSKFNMRTSLRFD